MNELQRINQQMGYIADLARTYANATPEQRARVNIEDVQAQLNRYNELKDRKQQLLAEQEDRWAKELEAWKQAQNIKQTIQWTGRRVPTPTPKQNVNQWYDYEEGGTIFHVDPNGNEYAVGWRWRPEWWDAPVDRPWEIAEPTWLTEDWQSQGTIKIWVSQSWAPYYYDTATWMQVAPTVQNADWTVTFSNWQKLRNITQDINNVINAHWLASQAAKDRVAAEDYAQKVRNQNIAINMAAVPAAMYTAELISPYLVSNAWTAGNLSRYTSGRWMSEPMTQAFRNTATRDYANGFARNIASNNTPSYLANSASRVVNTAPKVTTATNNTNFINNLNNAYNRAVAANRLNALNNGNYFVNTSNALSRAPVSNVSYVNNALNPVTRNIITQNSSIPASIWNLL